MFVTFWLSPAPVVRTSKLTLLANAHDTIMVKKRRYITHFTIRTGPSKHWWATIPESRDTVINTSHASVFMLKNTER